MNKVTREVQKSIRAMHASSKIAKIAHPYENIEAAVSSSLPILEKKYSAILTINEEEA